MMPVKQFFVALLTVIGINLLRRSGISCRIDTSHQISSIFVIRINVKFIVCYIQELELDSTKLVI